jgi:hypothetical protein
LWGGQADGFALGNGQADGGRRDQVLALDGDYFLFNGSTSAPGCTSATSFTVHFMPPDYSTPQLCVLSHIRLERILPIDPKCFAHEKVDTPPTEAGIQAWTKFLRTTGEGDVGEVYRSAPPP